MDLTPETLPRPFGNYLLLHRLGRGGMGEVYLAKQGGIAGIEHYCVVKAIRSEQAKSREAVARFIDEAAVLVHLNHRNICRVQRVGRVGDTLFVAMELVEGRNLVELLNTLRQGHTPLTEGVALHVVRETLSALDYAHRLQHPVTGEPMRIVHRDVSPHNVMVSFEGEVKLIDFGLAASTLKKERTAGGMVLGKISYMSPEQLRAEPVDERTDLYAVAVMAVEMLLGERFYVGLTPDQTFQSVGTGGYRPPGYARLAPELRAVLDKALAADREQRTRTTGQFRQEVSAYMKQRGLVADAEDLRAVIARLFPTGPEEQRTLLAQFATLDAPAESAEALETVTAPGVSIPRTPPGRQPLRDSPLPTPEVSTPRAPAPRPVSMEDGPVDGGATLRTPSHPGAPVATETAQTAAHADTTDEETPAAATGAAMTDASALPLVTGTAEELPLLEEGDFHETTDEEVDVHDAATAEARTTGATPAFGGDATERVRAFDDGDTDRVDAADDFLNGHTEVVRAFPASAATPAAPAAPSRAPVIAFATLGVLAVGLGIVALWLALGPTAGGGGGGDDVTATPEAPTPSPTAIADDPPPPAAIADAGPQRVPDAGAPAAIPDAGAPPAKKTVEDAGAPRADSVDKPRRRGSMKRRRSRRRSRSAKPPTPRFERPTTTTGKLQLMDKCPKPCARRLRRQKSRVGDMPTDAVRKFFSAVDRCVEVCVR